MPFSGLNKPEIPSRAYAIGAILNLVLNIVLIRLYGLIGAAFAVTITFSFPLLFLGYSLNKKIRIEIETRKVVLSFVSALLMGASIGAAADVTSVVGLVSLVFMGGVVYLLFMVLFKGVDKEDIALIKTLRS
jgi:O-antigen/teichoic acid export membrane protein